MDPIAPGPPALPPAASAPVFVLYSRTDVRADDRSCREGAMPRGRDLLHRFRPAGAPGSAGPRGVPADRAVELVDELAPVFARLEDTERACDLVRARADADAAALAARCAEQARTILAQADADAGAERADAAARLLAAVRTEHATTLAAAEGEAAAVRRRAAARQAVVVDRVVAEVAALIGELDLRQPTGPAVAATQAVP
jgi:hypothetical protein